MPSLEEMVQKFETWWTSSARVPVNWDGLAVTAADQKLVRAQVDGIVMLVQPEGERTEVIVFCPTCPNSTIRMYLTTGCTFQSLPLPHGEAFAGLESLVRIAFPTGELCLVHFFNPPS